MLLLIITYISFNILVFCQKLKKKKPIKIYLENSDIYFSNNSQKFLSIFVVGSFTVIFVALIRIYRIFNNTNKGFDVKIIFNKLFDGFFFFEKLMIIFIAIYFLIFFKKYVFSVTKLHYFKLHYYYFVRFTIYVKTFRFLGTYKLYLFRFLNESKIKYIFCSFFFHKAFSWVLILTILKNLILDDCILNTKLLLYYGLYKFFLNIIEHLNQNIVDDFEQGVIQYYFPDEFCITSLGMLKINLYLRNLICEKTKYEFIPNAIFDLDLRLKNAYSVNLVFFSSYYCHIDIYELLKTKTPRISEHK